MNEDVLQRAHAALQRQRRAGGTVDAPSPEQLQALVDGSLPASEREAVLDRVFASGATDELALLHTLASTAQTSSAPVTSLARRFAPWAAAAALLIVVGVPVARLVRVDRDADVRYRGADSAANLPTLVTPSAASDSVVFSWTAVRDADRYTMELLDEKAEIVLRRETTDTALTLPNSLMRAAGTRAAQDWWVVAHLRNGGQRRSALGAIGTINAK